MNFDVDARTIYEVVHGSQAYGLATPTSDLDIKGVCIEPISYHMGYAHHFEQREQLVNKGHPHDRVTYSLKKFVRLAADCNPNVIEVLFVDDEHIRVCDRFGKQLRDMRDVFVSKKARFTFAGYARGQIKRIETHRRWLLNPITHAPTREEYGLKACPVIPKDQLDAAQSLVLKKLEHWHFEDMSDLTPDQRICIQRVLGDVTTELMINRDEKWNLAGRSLGLNENFLEVLASERRFKQSMNDWDSYSKWLRERNPIRAEQERHFGYDVKHGSHLLRLMRMCKEILSGRGVLVKRPDAEELLAIKLYGTMKYDDLLAEATRLDEECAVLYKTSSLPHGPDVNMLNDFVVNLTEDYIDEYDRFTPVGAKSR